jgi:hypothetical protein
MVWNGFRTQTAKHWLSQGFLDYQSDVRIHLSQHLESGLAEVWKVSVMQPMLKL